MHAPVPSTSVSAVTLSLGFLLAPTQDLKSQGGYLIITMEGKRHGALKPNCLV